MRLTPKVPTLARYQGVCNLDGKLSVVHYRGRTLVFMRYNIKGNGWRHVQMTSSPDLTEWDTFYPIEVRAAH